MNYIDKVYKNFIKQGKVSTERERKKIILLLKGWCFISPETSNVSKKYLDIINIYVTDKKINDVLNIQPNLKGELVKNLFKLLEIVSLEINNEDESLEDKLLSDFKKMNDVEFKEVIEDKNNNFLKYIQTAYNNEKLNISDLGFELIEQERERQEKTLEIQKELADLHKQVQLNNIKLKTTEKELIHLKKQANLDLYKIRDTKNYIEHLENTIGNNQTRIKELIYNKSQVKYKLSKLKKDFIDSWEQQVSLRKIQEQIEKIDEIRTKFMNEFYKRIEDLKEVFRALKPFVSEEGELGRLWNLSPGIWKKVNFNLLEKYATLLKDKEDIQELAALLGKSRKSNADFIDESLENIEVYSRSRTDNYGKAELVGITESNNLNNLLPTELALFSDITTENIFYKKFAENKLNTYKYIDKVNDFATRPVSYTGKKQIEKDKGPFIIAIDTSGSMNGEPEFLAKIITYAITKIAINEKRKAYLISFSTNIHTFELTNIPYSLDKLVYFLQMSFYGGTDVSEAITEAVKQIQSKKYKNADVLIVSDGIFGKLEEETLNSINLLKNKGNKFDGLMIGSSYNREALKFCNNVWQFNPRNDDLKNLIEKIKKE